MRIVCLLLLLAGIVWNVRYAIADLAARRNQPGSTRLAMRIVPENQAYSAQLAEEVYATDPAQAEQLLQRAVRQNHYDAPRWIELALLFEEANKLPQAETALLEAAKVDATYLPNWSLANFYFRHGQSERFWASAKNAARLAPDDAAPLFRLAWYTNPDAAEVERQLSLSRGPKGEQFVNFLIGQGNAPEVAQAAEKLLEASSPILPRVCDWLIAQQRPDLALPLWSSLAAGGQVPAAQTGAVTNGNFGRSPLSLGFDWRLPPVDGVSSFWNSNPNALGFEFSGNEPDNFVLMSQTVLVQPGKSYVLDAAFRTQGIAAGSGIAWQVQDVQSGAVLARSGSLIAEQGGKTATCFSVPGGASSVNLSLAYQRQPGTVRVEGRISLDAVRLSAGPCPG